MGYERNYRCACILKGMPLKVLTNREISKHQPYPTALEIDSKVFRGK